MLDIRLQNLAVYAKNIVNFDLSDGKQPNQERPPETTSSTTDIHAWRRTRTQAKNLVQQYLDNPCDVDLLARSHELVEEFESIDDSTESVRFRSKVNVANLTGKMRRSHFTAYVAGQFSVDDRLPPIFKVWLHNAAAHSSLDLMDCIGAIENHIRPVAAAADYQSDEPNRTPEILKVFRNGAAEDTYRFLDLADKFGGGKHHCLTRFNMARLAAYRNRPSTAVDRIGEIEVPQKDDHPAILQWHIANLNSYQNDKKFNFTLKNAETNLHPEVLSKLNLCHEQADKYIESRGGREGMWSDADLSPEARHNYRLSKAVIAGCGAGSASLLFVGLPELTDSVMHFLQSLTEHLELIPETAAQELSQVSEESTVALGDGDWAVRLDSGVVRATFGDGDWA